MSNGEGREKEELFEDLDKFFAPIQDVEWPEPAETAAARRAAEREEGPPEGVEAEVSEVEAAEPGEAAPRVLEPEAGEETDTVALEEAAVEEVFEEGLEEPGEAAGRVQPEEAVEAEAWLRTEEEAPAAGEEEPAAAEEIEEAPEEEPAAAEEIEEAPEVPTETAEILVEEGPPSEEALEAAAEHFAGSIRMEEEEGEEGAEEEEEAAEAEGLLADLEAQPPSGRTIRVGGAEGMGGPSWQEPTSVEIGAEPEQPSRDVPAAFLTGLALAAVALGSLALSKVAFAVVAGAIVLVAQGELYAAMHRRHLHPGTALGLATGALVLAGGYFKGEAAMLAMLAMGTAATFLWYMAMPASQRRDIVSNVALTLMPVVYVALLAGYALTTLAIPDPPDGRALLLAVIGLTFVYDTAAFVVGYFWGSRPLAPTVSPRKSWEGAVGATLVVVAVSVGLVTSTVEALDTVGRAVGLAVVVAVFAPLGDLAESLLKRDLGLKDMSSILPGHGGVLDRIDSVLFVAPAALVFFRLVLG